MGSVRRLRLGPVQPGKARVIVYAATFFTARCSRYRASAGMSGGYSPERIRENARSRLS
jgi:hypothetical protein